MRGQYYFDDDDGRTASGLVHLLIDQAVKYGKQIGKLESKNEAYVVQITGLEGTIRDLSRIIEESSDASA